MLHACPPIPTPEIVWWGDAAGAALRSSGFWFVCLPFPMGSPQLLWPAFIQSSLKSAMGETTGGGNEGGVDALRVGTSQRTSSTEILWESSPLLHSQVRPCNSLFQTIMNDSIKFSFELFHPYITMKDDITSVSQREHAAKDEHPSGTRSLTIKQIVQSRTDSNIFQCMHCINISSSCCLCCTDWTRSSKCRLLCKQNLLCPM